MGIWDSLWHRQMVRYSCFDFRYLKKEYIWSFVCIYKDLYLVITLNLINLYVKSAALFTALFTEKHCAFHFLLCFSLKSTVLFQWKAQKQLIQHRSLSLTWSFIEYRGRYILLVLKSAALFIWKTILQGIVSPMFFSLSVTSQSQVFSMYRSSNPISYTNISVNMKKSLAKFIFQKSIWSRSGSVYVI